MNLKAIKLICSTTLLFIGAQFFFQAILDSQLIAVFPSAVVAVLGYILFSKIPLTDNTKLLGALFLFALLSVAPRFVVNLADVELIGKWQVAEPGEELVFHFLDGNFVSVEIGEGQEEELVYKYRSENGYLIFFQEDTIRFKWEITQLTSTTLEISQGTEKLQFNRL